MKDLGLFQSFQHQDKFFRQKSFLTSTFPKEKRYPLHKLGDAVIPVNQEFFYLHIWKSGGTSIQTHTNHYFHYRLDDPQVQEGSRSVSVASESETETETKIDIHPKFFTYVRDPVDHFLSGWSESSARQYKERLMKYDMSIVATIDEESYDQIIQTYLKRLRLQVHQMILGGEDSIFLREDAHALPQANFVLNDYGTVLDRLVIVGDLQDHTKILYDVVGYHPSESINHTARSDNHFNGIARAADEDAIKLKYFPAKREWLSNETIRLICDFVEMDYFLFDFQPPEPCTELFSSWHGD